SLGVLTAGVAHEINNPVNYIKTSAHALKQDMDDVGRFLDALDELLLSCPDASVKERIAAIKSDIDYDALTRELPGLVNNITMGAARAEEIVDSLRTYAWSDDRKKTPAAVDELIDAALVLLKNRYKKTVAITKSYGDPPRAPVQPGRLIQVFSNVIGNAIDAVTEDCRGAAPAIEIRTGVEERDGVEYVVVEVIDNGPGVRGDIIDKIFDPFFTTKEVGKGVGLGMSISHGIIRDHNGRIHIRGRDGRGAVVSILLPIVREDA
ncbi:MAG: histidine kinase, partial [Desulfobacterales bacterium]|nr:histidine kinase [Desulfobacterales bacterium]